MSNPDIEFVIQYYGYGHQLDYHFELLAAARDIGPRLCQADADEARAATGKDPARVPYLCVRDTARSGGMVGVCRVNGRPELIYGWRSKGLLSNEAEIWMLHTAEPERWPRLFARESQAALADMMLMAAAIRRFENVVHRDNKNAIRWLKWLGFRIDRKVGREWLHFYGDVSTLRTRGKHVPGVRIRRSEFKADLLEEVKEAEHGRRG